MWQGFKYLAFFIIHAKWLGKLKALIWQILVKFALIYISLNADKFGAI